MDGKDLVQLALPASVLEDLLRRHQLHLEQLHSLDPASHQAVQRAVMKALVSRRS